MMRGTQAISVQAVKATVIFLRPHWKQGIVLDTFGKNLICTAVPLNH